MSARKKYKEEVSHQGQGLTQELEEKFSTGPVCSGGESFTESSERSKQKTKEGRPRSQSTGTTESSEESGEGLKQRIKEFRPILQSAGDTGSSEVESEGSGYASESGSTHPAHTMVGTPYQVRDMLNRNMLFYNEREVAEASGAALIASARGILSKKRGSDWSKEKRLQVMQGIEDYSQELEATFVVNLMKHLHGDTRKVPRDKPLSDTDFEQEYNWIEAAWKKDHLRLRYNVNFLTDCLPQIHTGDAYLDKLIEEVPRVENSAPDVAFGIYQTAFSLLEREILNNQHCNLAGPRLYGVFFAIEAKCMNASIEEAENQCLRTGCAMVSTSRRLNQAANSAPKATASASSSSSAVLPTSSLTTVYPTADMDSFAFTLAVGSQCANMFVNWALEMDSDDTVQWHMHYLQSYDFRKPDDLNQLHHDMNAVLDWGLSARKDKIIDCCTKVYDSGIIQQSRKRQRTDRKDKGPELC